MLSRVVRRRLASAAQSSRYQPGRVLQRRWNTPAPKAGDGPLMSRRADRELPEFEAIRFRWGRTLPIFIALVTACSIAIFNYQKSSSPVIASTLYALRTNPRARELLGDEIYFNRQIPWIHGEMNQLHGRIDVWFDVKGSKGKATMRFASFRKTPRGMFETTEWSLKTEDGEWVDLLEAGDPFGGLVAAAAADVPVEAAFDDEDAGGRGYRQQSPYK